MQWIKRYVTIYYMYSPVNMTRYIVKTSCLSEPGKQRNAPGVNGIAVLYRLPVMAVWLRISAFCGKDAHSMHTLGVQLNPSDLYDQRLRSFGSTPQGCIGPPMAYYCRTYRDNGGLASLLHRCFLFTCHDRPCVSLNNYEQHYIWVWDQTAFSHTRLFL